MNLNFADVPRRHPPELKCKWTPPPFARAVIHFKVFHSACIPAAAVLFFPKSATGVMYGASLRSAASSLSPADALSLASAPNHINLTTRWRPRWGKKTAPLLPKYKWGHVCSASSSSPLSVHTHTISFSPSLTASFSLTHTHTSTAAQHSLKKKKNMHWEMLRLGLDERWMTYSVITL